jgi:hypothetical protein
MMADLSLFAPNNFNTTIAHNPLSTFGSRRQAQKSVKRKYSLGSPDIRICWLANQARHSLISIAFVMRFIIPFPEICTITKQRKRTPISITLGQTNALNTSWLTLEQS